jgi:CO/xanthine dehydrogenase Mo-binding subunit
MSVKEEPGLETIDVFGATLTRSSFVKGVGGMVVGFSLLGAGLDAKAAQAAGVPLAAGTANTVDASQWSSWLTINPDNTIVIRTGKAEMGQGSASTAYGQITAEELNVPYSAITQVIMGNTDQTPDGGFSAGYIVPAGGNVRKAAALVYQALLALASQQLSVPVANLTVTNGVVSGGGRTISYGDLVKSGQFSLTIPVAGSLQSLFGYSITANPPTKPVSQYQIVGQSIPMRTIPPIVTGTATYIGDVRLPGMLHARVVHPPTLGSQLLSPGTLDKAHFPNTQVIAKHNLLAAVDPQEYVAIEAAALLGRGSKWTTWSGLPGSGNLFGALRHADWTTTPVQYGANVGNPSSALAGAAKTLAATYEYPFEKHAPIGPTCAVGDVQSNGTIVVHMHGQNPTACRWEIAQMMNVPIDKVVVRWYDGSGHYGRSNGGNTGAEEEAVVLSSIVGKPVRVQWMRWDDMQWSTQHPPSFSDVQAGLDGKGNLIAFRVNHYMPAMQDDRPVGALLAGLPTMSAPGVVPYPGTFGSTPNSIQDPWVYDRVSNALQAGFGTFQVGTDPNAPDFNTQIGMRGHSMRTPGQRQQNFAQESAISELAALAAVDPIQFRLNHTTNPRVINVLNTVKQASGWETRPSPNPHASNGSGLLLGQGCSQMSRASAQWACVAKVAVNPKTGKVQVTDVATVGDVGILVNPRQQQRMMAGGAVMAVSEALHEQVTFDTGAITTRDWVTFPILRFVELPKITTIAINNPTASGSSMTGVFGMGGEGPNGFVQAAIANAIFDATGKQPRRLPFSPGAVRALLAT